MIAAAVVGLGVWYSSKENTKETEETGNTTDNGTDGISRVSADDLEAIFAEAGEVTNEEELREAMDADDVSAIILSEDADIYISDGILQISKPILIPSNQQLTSAQAIVVVDGGIVDIQGDLSVDQGFLRIAGGSVYVEDGGILNLWKLWVEQEDDLVLESGASLDLYGQDSLEAADSEAYLVFSEETAFANAVEVSTEEALRSALDDPDTEAVRVTSGSEIIFSEDEIIIQSVPVLIEEGASVTSSDKTYDAGGWCVDGSILVNRGSMTLCLSAGQSDDFFTIVNYGSMSGSLDYSGDGNFINIGELEPETASAFDGDFINLGTAVFGDGENNWFFDFRDNGLFNYGTLTLEGRSGGETYLSSNYRFVNAGTIEIGDYASVENSGIIENFGTLSLTASTAEVSNGGLIDSAAPASLITAASGSRIGGPGILAYSSEDTVPFDNVTTRTICATDYDGEYVTTQEELERALADGSVDLIVIDAEIEASGDLTVNKMVVNYGGLTVEGCLSVAGNGGIISHGLLGGGSLAVSEGASVACMDDFDFADVTVENEGMLLASLYGSRTIGNSLTVGSDGNFVLLTDAYWTGVDISVETGGSLNICGELSLSGCTVTVAEGGVLATTHAGDIYMDGDTELINYGEVDVCSNHWIYTIEMRCAVQNYGEMNLDADANMIVSGSFANYGVLYARYNSDEERGLVVTGSLDNQGELYLDTEGEPEVVTMNSGVFTGSAAKAGTYWD
ncbi:MAG: hypothetical protein LIO96_03020 [Lachnospiraceae bacterium]|nr:hypothetical protein [Lachnospiraceae bacterium]